VSVAARERDTAAGRCQPDPVSVRLQDRRGEARLPAVIVTLLAVAIYALLPQSLLVGPRLLIPALEVLLFIPLVGINPQRLTRETRWSRLVSLALVIVIAGSNTVALVLLLHRLGNAQLPHGSQLLLAALQVWGTNVMVFGLIYWELDRGGPVSRNTTRRELLPPADFRFSQDENQDAVVEVARTASKTTDWVPTLVDYLYVSLTNSSAFSPTDTMPLRPRTKLLMGVQATTALVTSVLVIARGVSLLSGG
jgi:hypothetical protein